MTLLSALEKCPQSRDFSGDVVVKNLLASAGDGKDVGLIPGFGGSPGEGIGSPLQCSWGFPGGSDGKESSFNVGDLGSIPGLGRSPGGGHGNPLQYSCLEGPHGQRRLAGYSPWGHKELAMTERLSTVQHQYSCLEIAWAEEPGRLRSVELQSWTRLID